ncbi:hypothetical protein POG85_004084 [Salmonella enterica]|nr:hypothetical protein [Salmonella enterica]
MKKTLIALAVAASAAVSGSAMAAAGVWTESSTGDTFNISGSLKPAANVTPWMVMVSGPLDMGQVDIKEGRSEVTVQSKADTGILGIRVNTTKYPAKKFNGAPSIAPRISIASIKASEFSASKVPLSVPLKDATSGADIGTFNTKLAATAMISFSNHADKKTVVAYSQDGASAFAGGIPDAFANVANVDYAVRFFSDIRDYFDTQGGDGSFSVGWSSDLVNPTVTYSAYYGAGILSGEDITLQLNDPVNADISWKAEVPVTISYS